MKPMRRPWILFVLIGCALIGAGLILTAEDDDPGPALEDVVTEEGLATRVPDGWVAADGASFEFSPPGTQQQFDQWTIAQGCPDDGCRTRSLGEWLALADGLPTFENLEDADGDTIFGLTVEELPDARVLRAQTEAGGRLVFVAAFTDGAEAYVACSVRISIAGDEGLADAVLDVCRATEPVSGATPAP